MTFKSINQSTSVRDVDSYRYDATLHMEAWRMDVPINSNIWLHNVSAEQSFAIVMITHSGAVYKKTVRK